MSEPTAKRLIEITVGPCTEQALMDCVEYLQETLDKTWPSMGAAISARLSLPPLGTVELHLTKAEREAVGKAHLGTGWGVRQSNALQSAERKLKAAVLSQPTTRTEQA